MRDDEFYKEMYRRECADVASRHEAAAVHAKRLSEIVKRCKDTGDRQIYLQDAHTINEAASFLANDEPRG